jgi:hypothetical protein
LLFSLLFLRFPSLSSSPLLLFSFIIFLAHLTLSCTRLVQRMCRSTELLLSTHIHIREYVCRICERNQKNMKVLSSK